MACFHPLEGYRSLEASATGKYPLIFTATGTPPNRPWAYAQKVPCGRCVGCKLDRARHWAIRCMHEAQMHEDNCFVTLTYRDEHLPPGRTLVKKDVQDFMKRLRERVGAVRYLYCGEYGTKLGRPHYHLLLFGFRPTDLKTWKVSGSGHRLCNSELLDDTWGKGFVVIGDVSFESSAYVARYITKKVNGKGAAEHYGNKLPEYSDPSRRPGIGKPWFDRYWTDVYNEDHLVVMRDGKALKFRPPRFYDKLLEKFHPDVHARIKAKREARMAAVVPDDFERLLIREQVALLKLKELKREYEETVHGV